MENGYGEKEPLRSEYPIRAFDSGHKGALELILTNYVQDCDKMCNPNCKKLSFFLTVPGETSEFKSSSHIDISDDAIISIKPKSIITSRGLRRYNPMPRDCFFRNEPKLQFFKTYTKDNCQMECLANLTMKKCGCVRFNMPSMYRYNYYNFK